MDKNSWEKHIRWQTLVFMDDEEEELPREEKLFYADYRGEIVERTPRSIALNEQDYEAIPAEGNNEFQRYWEEDWNRRMQQQRN